MEKWVYNFEEGNKDMKMLLGGKGANLAEMTTIGLPVPGGFTNPGDVSSFTTGTVGQYSVIISDPAINCPSTEQSCTISILASPSVVFLSPP